MEQRLQAHSEIQGRYENPTVLRGKSGDYFIVMDLLYDPKQELLARIGQSMRSADVTSPLLDSLSEFLTKSGQGIGFVRAKNKFFQRNKTRLSTYSLASYYPEDEAFTPGLAYSSYNNIIYGKFLNPDIVRIEFYIDNLLQQTFTRNKATDYGTGDFFLVELDKKYFKYGSMANIRFIYYNAKGEVIGEYGH